jgi:rhamnogalacturonyl hydrolase YesR
MLAVPPIGLIYAKAASPNPNPYIVNLLAMNRVFMVSHNNTDKHAYAGATDSFTHLRVLLVRTDRGILTHSN